MYYILVLWSYLIDMNKQEGREVANGPSILLFFFCPFSEENPLDISIWPLLEPFFFNFFLYSGPKKNFLGPSLGMSVVRTFSYGVITSTFVTF